MRYRFAIVAIALVSFPALARAAKWEVERINHVTLPAPATGAVLETSGVTYVGPVGDAHRFIAVQQNHGNVVRFDVTFTDAGGIASIANVANIAIVDALDFEGIAYTNADRNSVFMSEENNPGVREVSLSTGATIQTVAIPTVFASRRNNRGFEALTRTLDGSTMWTGNEEALTVDGPASTPMAPTTVRLLMLNVEGNTVGAGPQFAYRVEPIHSASGASRSGLNDMTAMPDGTLLTLERSAAATVPLFLNRIFEVDFQGATDVSVGATAGGLSGKSFTPVGKELLWSGAVDGGLGQNFEGLGLGPRLANGSWVLLGVVDSTNGGAGNTVVAFSATANHSADFDEDGDVDNQDFMAWQRGLGTTIGAKFAEGDADRDGDVDSADLDIWKSLQPEAMIGPAPEPTGVTLLAPGLVALIRRRRTRRGRKKSG